MMLLKIKKINKIKKIQRAEGYKWSRLLSYMGPTCLDRIQHPDVCVCVSVCTHKKRGGWEEEERTIQASISPLYYVPACVSSLMQSPCPPNVTHTHTRARKGMHALDARTRRAVFMLSLKKKKAAFQVEQGFLYVAYIYIYFIFFVLFLFYNPANRVQVQLIHNRLLSPRELRLDRSVISR